MWKALLVSVALLAGCTRVTYVNTMVRPSGAGVVHTGNFFLFGLVGHADIWANQDCPRGVASVVSEFSPLDILLGLIMLELYTPRTYLIGCGA